MIQNKEKMETNFNFKSQICTTKEQSKQLLKLGLKKETADMVYTNASLPYNEDVFHLICKEYSQLNKKVNYEISPFTFIPAWSMHRLIEIMPKTIIVGPSLERWNLHITHESVVYCNQKDASDWLEKFSGQVMYNNIINCIECLIREGYFNEKYLVR